MIADDHRDPGAVWFTAHVYVHHLSRVEDFAHFADAVAARYVAGDRQGWHRNEHGDDMFVVELVPGDELPDEVPLAWTGSND